MGKKPKKDGAATSAPKTSAETISDDQLYSLTEQHRQKYELLLEGRHKANKALIDYGKIIKSDLGAHGLQDIKDLISLDTPEGEAAMKADMERQARVFLKAKKRLQRRAFRSSMTPRRDCRKRNGRRKPPPTTRPSPRPSKPAPSISSATRRKPPPPPTASHRIRY